MRSREIREYDYIIMIPIKKTSTIGSLLGGLFIAGIAVAYVVDTQFMNTDQAAPVAEPVVTKQEPQPAETTPAPVATDKKPAPTPAPAPAPTSRYTNGSYNTTVQYRTPESVESLAVTLTVKDDTIADASIAIDAAAKESRRYQEAFAANYTQYVVGKSLESLKLSRVSGSSLTTAAFNKALDAIRTTAGA